MYKQIKMYKSIKYKPFCAILMNTTGTMMQTLWMTHMRWLKLYNYNCEDIITKIVLYPGSSNSFEGSVFGITLLRNGHTFCKEYDKIYDK